MSSSEDKNSITFDGTIKEPSAIWENIVGEAHLRGYAPLGQEGGLHCSGPRSSSGAQQGCRAIGGKIKDISTNR